MSEEINMSTRKERIKEDLNRFVKFIKVFTRNKRGMLGLSIILLFVFLAAAAPLLTPYDEWGRDPKNPDRELAAPASGISFPGAPVWLRHLPPMLGGIPTLSENMRDIIKNPSCPLPIEYGGEWNLTKPIPKEVTIIPNATEDYGGGTSGSLGIRFERTGSPVGEVKIEIYKDFYFPYSGPPGDFVGRIDVLVEGSMNETTKELYVPVRINVFIDNGTRRFDLWPPLGKVVKPDGRWKLANYLATGYEINYTVINPETGEIDGRPYVAKAPGKWLSSGPHIRSRDHMLQQRIDQWGDPPQVIRKIFTKTPGWYRFGVEITFIDQAKEHSEVEAAVYVDNLNWELPGTCFGLLGVDGKGKDLFSQLVYGTRISLYVGTLTAILSVVIGLVVGLAAGYLGRLVDEFLMRFSDMLLVLPGLPLLIVLSQILTPSVETLILVLAFLGWMGFARTVRSQVLSLKERPFIEAAKAVGAGKSHIIFRHIMPNVMGLVYVSLATSVPGAIVVEASLSFLGLGDMTKMSWGRMMQEGLRQARNVEMWWWILIPGFCIALMAVAFILLGFALDEILNPKLRLRR